MEPWVIATGLIFLYVLVTLVLGFVANRRLTIDLEDFFLYYRGVGLVKAVLIDAVSGALMEGVSPTGDSYVIGW